MSHFERLVTLSTRNVSTNIEFTRIYNKKHRKYRNRKKNYFKREPDQLIYYIFVIYVYLKNEDVTMR